MIVKCAKCNEFIKDARTQMFPDTGTVELIVSHHGEIDKMKFTQEWMADNQDFMFMITNNLTQGVAFSEDKEYEKVDGDKGSN